MRKEDGKQQMDRGGREGSQCASVFKSYEVQLLEVIGHHIFFQNLSL